ncbi:MAG: flavodoxin family protein [Nitrospirota bacterium]
MNIIAFLGSPREGGNTELLLKEAVRGIEDSGFSVRLFNMNSMNIMPCQNCGGCEDSGMCVYADDMTQIYEAIRTADRVILASPIFFSALSAQIKVMLDRCQAFWCEKYLLKKSIPAGPHGRKGLLLLVGGQKKDTGIQCAAESARVFFRTISIAEHKTLGYTGVDTKGAILSHPTAMKDAYEAGKELVAGY